MALAAIKYDTRKGDIDRTEIRDYLRQYFPRILEKWDPEVSKFSTWVTNNIKYKAQAAYETFKNSDTVSIDVQAGEIGSVAELAAPLPRYTKYLSAIEPALFLQNCYQKMFPKKSQPL
jgi:hypothetical protein